MKKRFLFIMLIAICLLSSCTKTPENIEGANHNIDLKSTNKVSVEHILDDFDEAFKTEYTKFKLPDKSSVIINQPEGVYDLELKYVNDKKNIEWIKNKLIELAKIFDIPDDRGIENVNNENSRFILETPEKAIDITIFSSPYFILKKDYDLNNMVITKTKYLDRTSRDKLNQQFYDIVKTASPLADNINDIMESKLNNIPTDLYIKDYNGEEFYELDLQQSYKGIGIQCIFPKHPTEEMLMGDNSIMAMSMYTHLLLDSNLNLNLYIGCNGYIPVKSEPIKNMISFKGACDILESELAENTNFEFDDVKLWYEPRGTIIDLSDSSVSTYDAHDGNKTIKCTPKWYFISDESSEAELHMINYITVDCVTGEIEVFFPG